jgi:putative membrane protein
MYINRSYPLSLLLGWTAKFILVFLLIDAVPVLLHRFLDYDFIRIPWLPIALIGTALAFYLGFKTNASYDRLWEARKIWGSIVNDSRSFAVLVDAYVKDTEVKRRIIRRHVAWLTALRFQMRERRGWEHNNLRDNAQYRNSTGVDEFDHTLSEKLPDYLSEEEVKAVLALKNPAVHILHNQMSEISALRDKEELDGFKTMEMSGVIRNLHDHQGKSERIKNFPFPRQYASLNFYYVWLFIILLPFGMIGEFEKLGENYVWMSIPFCTIISWVFYTMEMIGDYSENPFEGSFNDVPITTICRTIETDLFEMIQEPIGPANANPSKLVVF